MKFIYTLLVTALLSACGGTNFIRSDADPLVLGTTSQVDIVKRLGAPRTTANITKNEVSIERTAYSYAEAIPFSTILSTRAMVFFFHDGLLVGYDYVSSFSGEKQASTIDDEKVKQLKKGDKKERVSELLGVPSGEFMFPMTSPKGTTSVIYSFISTSRVPFLVGVKTISKNVTVTINSNGLISDISTTETKPN
jgi:hypothetical protein